MESVTNYFPTNIHQFRKNMNMTSFLGTSPVTIVGNPAENNAIITPNRDAQGNPKTDLKGNPLGSLRLEQESVTLNGTFLNASKRVAFMAGTIDQLTKITTAMKLTPGATVPGKIVQKESLFPMWQGQNPKMNPTTEEVIAIEVNGRAYPVYMQQRYTDNTKETDNLIRTADDVIAILAAAQTENANVNTVREEAGVPTP